MSTNKKISEFDVITTMAEGAEIPVIQGSPKQNARISQKNFTRDIGLDAVKNKVDNLEVSVADDKLKVTSVAKTYQTEALAFADKNPIDTTTSLPLTVGQFVSIVDDGEKNGIYRIGSIGGDGTMSLELQGKLGDLSDYAKLEQVDKLSTKYLDNSYSDTGVDIPLEGSIEIVFHLDELKAGCQILNSYRRTPFLVLSSDNTLYTKIGDTRLYNIVSADVNTLINIKMVWSASNVTIFANGKEVVNQVYEGTTEGTLAFSNSDDLYSFKGVIYKCIMKNSNGEILYNGSGFSTDENVELYNRINPLTSEIIGWATSESYSASNIVFDSNGIISSADIKWLDNDLGTISDVITNNNGIESMRYNRSNGDYVLMNITYNNDGVIKTQKTEYITI